MGIWKLPTVLSKTQVKLILLNDTDNRDTFVFLFNNENF